MKQLVPANFISALSNCRYEGLGNVELIDFLVEHGLDVNARDSAGFTVSTYSY